ncbi:transcriptional regulator [Zhengella mangrovi]|uniref:Transcriptional regulator n=1 Tax=Zhengella mangrovi TaxID=1982044 RepID=A0A2G1QQZ6_9HYPH|nr:MarR family transcriptional regulator [Zhengella mangrovi]PHP67899.1 transcriptional regulator [Zhengella mangrovi]
MLDFQEMPGHLIRRLHQISVSVFADDMARSGLDITPVQFAALNVLQSRPGIDQATLAGLIAYDRVTIGGVVDRLVQKDLVTRTVNPDDRRARRLHLTGEGERVLASAAPIVRDVQARILSGLDDGERAMLLSLLKKTAAAGNELSRAPLRDGPGRD